MHKVCRQVDPNRRHKHPTRSGEGCLFYFKAKQKYTGQAGGRCVIRRTDWTKQDSKQERVNRQTKQRQTAGLKILGGQRENKAQVVGLGGRQGADEMKRGKMGAQLRRADEGRWEGKCQPVQEKHRSTNGTMARRSCKKTGDTENTEIIQTKCLDRIVTDAYPFCFMDDGIKVFCLLYFRALQVLLGKLEYQDLLANGWVLFQQKICMWFSLFFFKIHNDHSYRHLNY